ncbi:MAG TPA: TerC family protein [Pseudolabrys sp.]|jgi:YjbE family integral membrane protein|nr:TerC family protein [Pseudolabrys sp.]
MAELASYLQPDYVLRIFEIIWINILLSGDNALVIALACRSLPPKQRLWGMVLGALVAVGMRIAFSAIVSNLMAMPYVKLAGGCALLWIAVSLLKPQSEAHDPQIESHDSLLRAIKTIALADIIMSLDNVIAVAGAAGGDTMLLVFGLGISVPLIVAGASLTMLVLTRLPILAWAGAALLGWIGGDMIASDPVVSDFADNADVLAELDHRKGDFAAALGATAVVAIAAIRRRYARLTDSA